MKRILLCFLPFFALQAGNLDVPQLTLSASATIWKPSDQLQMKIGVVTRGDTAREALAQNSMRMQTAIDCLKRISLTEEDYETSQFSINPIYSICPPNPPPSWRAEIVGYEVTNTLLIHTAQLDMAGQIIDLANKAGANSITDIRFGLRSCRDYWTEALSAAGANAVADAQAIARSTGVNLVRVLSISLNHTQVSSHTHNVASFAKVAGTAPPIEPGEVSLTANVTLIYQIE